MKNPAIKILAVAIATALCGTASAGETKDHDKHDMRASVDAEMRIMDTNKDGKISAAEHAAGAEQMFMGMDANQDNRVTAAEMDAGQKPIKSQDASHGASAESGEAAKHKGHEMASSEKIKAIDANGDGALSAQEHADGSKRMFGKMDSNKDGNLTAAEIQAGHASMMTAHD